MPRTLDGIAVVDLTQNIAGPYCAQLLGDFGANVIKVERPRTGDDVRGYAPSWGGEAAAFLAFNRNKKSICIDLKNPAGQAIIRRLCNRADVFIHSLKPGDVEVHGLGYERLEAMNPRLIYSSISGFGEKGPLKNLPGYDPVAQAYSGTMTTTGHPGTPPARIAIPMIDMGAGMWAFIGVMAALYERIASGKGARISASLLETGVSWNTQLLSNYLATGKLPEKYGSASPILAPYQAFEASDGPVFIAAGNDRLFAKLCRMLEIEELIDDPRYRKNADRVARRDELRGIIEERTRKRPAAEWVEKIRAAGIPGGPINTLDRVVADEQVAAVGMLKKFADFRVPDFIAVDLPVSLNGEKADIRLMPPRLGEHTDEIMRWASYRDEEIAQLHKSAIIS